MQKVDKGYHTLQWFYVLSGLLLQVMSILQCKRSTKTCCNFHHSIPAVGRRRRQKETQIKDSSVKRIVHRVTTLMSLVIWVHALDLYGIRDFYPPEVVLLFGVMIIFLFVMCTQEYAFQTLKVRSWVITSRPLPDYSAGSFLVLRISTVVVFITLYCVINFGKPHAAHCILLVSHICGVFWSLTLGCVLWTNFKSIGDAAAHRKNTLHTTLAIGDAAFFAKLIRRMRIIRYVWAMVLFVGFSAVNLYGILKEVTAFVKQTYDSPHFLHSDLASMNTQVEVLIYLAQVVVTTFFIYASWIEKEVARTVSSQTEEGVSRTKRAWSLFRHSTGNLLARNSFSVQSSGASSVPSTSPGGSLPIPRRNPRGSIQIQLTEMRGRQNRMMAGTKAGIGVWEETSAKVVLSPPLRGQILFKQNDRTRGKSTSEIENERV